MASDQTVHPNIQDHGLDNSTTHHALVSPTLEQSTIHHHGHDYIRMTPAFQTLSAIGICMLVVVAVVGNTMTMTAYIRDQRLRSVYNFYIFNLSVTDALIGCISMPFYAAYTLKEFRWTLGAIFCKIWLVVDFTLCLESILLILLLSVDRLLLVTYGPHYIAKVAMAKAITVISVTWILAFLLYGPAILGWDQWTGHSMVGHLECDVEFSNNFEFTATTAIVEFVIPLVCLVVLNTMIYIKIKQRKGLDADDVSHCERSTPSVQTNTTETHEDNDSFINMNVHSKFRLNHLKRICNNGTAVSNRDLKARNLPKSRSKRELKAARFLAILVVVFLVCWFPYTVITIIVSFCYDGCVNTSVYECTNWLLWSKSAINPCLYAMNSSGYRRNFKQMLAWGKKNMLPLKCRGKRRCDVTDV